MQLTDRISIVIKGFLFSEDSTPEGFFELTGLAGGFRLYKKTRRASAASLKQSLNSVTN